MANKMGVPSFLSCMCVLVYVTCVAAYYDKYNGYVGRPCQLRNGHISTCVVETDCPSAIKDKIRGIRPIVCGYRGFALVVCCPGTSKKSGGNPYKYYRPTYPPVWYPDVSTTPDQPETTPEQPPPEITPKTTIEQTTSNPITVEGSTNVGKRAASACGQYMRNWIPVPKIFIYGGEDANVAEFPHMALIGYPYNGNPDTLGQISDGRNVSWRCGGSLISDKFVLTAAHCVVRLGEEAPLIVRLGELDWASDSDGAIPQDFMIKRIILQPEYRSQRAYNDIALLELERPVVFTVAVQPACLPRPDDQDLTGRMLVVTGWGDLAISEMPSLKVRSHLMKAVLEVRPLDVCNRTYMEISDRGYLPLSLMNRGHLCAQHMNSSSCPGDSGGPLQESIPGSPLYRVVGVVSLGKGCPPGLTPGLYTKVADYVDWIEEEIWPNK